MSLNRPFGGGVSSGLLSPSPILFAAHGGRINTIASGYGSSGGKTSWFGRRPFRFGAVPPLAIRFGWLNWFAQASTAAAEVLGTVPIVHRQAYLRTSTAFTPVTIGGAVPVVPLQNAANPYTLSDWVFPTDLGVMAFPAGGNFEFGGLGDYQGNTCPVNSATNRPGGGQSGRYAPANEGGINFASVAGAVTFPSGFDSLPVPMPAFVIGLMPSGAQAVIGLAADSMGAQTGDIQGWGPTGGGWIMRAAYLAGIPGFNGGISGQTAAHLLAPSNLGLRDSLMPLGTLYPIQLGTNDFAAGNQPVAAPSGAASVLANVKMLAGKFKAASGGGTVTINTIPPRTTAGNFTQHTTLADQVPDTNFGAGSMRSDLNASLLADPGSAGADFTFDMASFCQDATDPTLWKVGTYTTTLAAAVTANATSYQLNAAPYADANLVIDAGNSGVDTSGVSSGSGMYAAAGQVTGSAAPFTVASSWTDPFSNSVVSWNPALAHLINAPVRDRMSPDGIHIAATPLKLAARPLAALFSRAARR